MAAINKPSQPLIPPTDIEDVEGIVAEAIASDDTHAPLVDDKVPAANLPSYVDDVLNFDSADEFPEDGEEGKIYVANDTNLTYRWSGVAYIQVGGASLAPGGGIDIENDIVSVDMEYVAENLDHVTEEELAEGLAPKANIADTYTKAQVDAAIAPKANNADVELALNGKQDSISDLDTIRSGAGLGSTAVQPADMEAALNEKQDALEFNPTIPSGVTPVALSMIKDGDNYYAPDGKQWTFLTSAMTNEERIALLQTATLPYVYFDSYIFTHRDSYGHYHFAQLSINVAASNTPTLDNLQLKQTVIDGYGKIINQQYLSGATTITQYNDNDFKIPSSSAVVRYVGSQLTAKQNTLVSGTNIKTINGQSVLGEGDLVIQGGDSVLEIVLTPTGETEEGYPNGTLSDEDYNTLLALPTNVKFKLGADADISILFSFGEYVWNAANDQIVSIRYHNITDDVFPLFRVDTDSKYWVITPLAYAPAAEVQEMSETVAGLVSAMGGKQDSLVSGTNIKTINGQSILGSGDLEIALSQSAEAEVQSMIDAAIGTALDEEY